MKNLTRILAVLMMAVLSFSSCVKEDGIFKHFGSIQFELETTAEREQLHQNISFFNSELKSNQLDHLFISSNSAIHCCVISGNEKVKEVATILQNQGFGVKPILSPTVPEGKERLRFCIHSYNTTQEISEVIALLANFVQI